MTPKHFYFINKDATSAHLTQSRGTQWCEIQSHVQKGLSRPRKAKNLLKKEVALVDEKALYNPTARSISCATDPFGTASIRIDSTVRTLLNYYINYYHPAIWTNDPSAVRYRPCAFKSAAVDKVNTALQDSLTMYSLLSAAASRVRHTDALSIVVSPGIEHYYTQQALRLMQERINGEEILASAATERLARCIMFLSSAECYRDDYSACRTHFEAALKLVERSGGVTQVQDKSLQGHLLMIDLFLSCVELVPCLSGNDYDPGPASMLSLSDEELLLTDEPVLGHVLMHKDETILPVSLWECVLQIIESYSVKRRLNTSTMSPQRSFETTHWVTKRNMAIRNRLLAIQTPDERVHALRTALVMWTLLAMDITGRVRAVKIMACRLKSLLERIPSCQWNDHHDVRFWILLMGYSCAEDNSTTHRWFVEEIRTRYGLRPHIIQEHWHRGDLSQALETFQQGFLFHAPVQRSRTERLAKHLSTWDDFVAV